MKFMTMLCILFQKGEPRSLREVDKSYSIELWEREGVLQFWICDKCFIFLRLFKFWEKVKFLLEGLCIPQIDGIFLKSGFGDFFRRIGLIGKIKIIASPAVLLSENILFNFWNCFVFFYKFFFVRRKVALLAIILENYILFIIIFENNILFFSHKSRFYNFDLVRIWADKINYYNFFY